MFVIRQVLARRPLLAWRAWGAVSREADLLGAVLLSCSLAGIILAFASADPEQQVLSPAAPLLLVGAAVFAGLFAWRQGRAPHPLIPRATFRATPAWGALVISFFIGSALIAALVDIPFFARITVYRNSQLEAALVLLRFLVALPFGAVLGGWLTRRVSAAALTAGAMVVTALAFLQMARWEQDTLTQWTATVPLVLAGVGFGLAIAPVNAAVLAHTRQDAHGVASALLVVARMVGMLIGISALTAIGLRRFYAASAEIPRWRSCARARRRRARRTTRRSSTPASRSCTRCSSGRRCAP
ncbi:MAG: MFS transporter [Nocardioidaceae bacterium]